MQQQYGWSAPPPRVPPPPRERSYAGVPDRFGGLILDGLLLGVAQIPVFVVWLILVWFVNTMLSSSEACTFDRSSGVSPQRQYEACVDSAAWWNVALVAVLVLALIALWWRLIAGRMVRRGASVGMSFAGLTIEEAESDLPVGVLRVLARCMLAAFMPLLFVMVPLILVVAMIGIDPDRAEVMVFGVLALIVVAAFAYLLPWLWALWDRRHQTLYDKAAGTVVLGPDGPTEGWSVAALVCGVIAAFGAYPLGPLALIFGSIGIRRMHGTRGQYKGRGAARAGQALGVLTTISLLFWVVGFGLAAWQGNRNEACREELDGLRVASVEFHAQQGRLPESDAELVFAGQLDEESKHYEVGSSGGQLAIMLTDLDCPPPQRR